MSEFLDTNVLVYLTARESAKASQARALLKPGNVVSVQVLNEFVSAALKKRLLQLAEIRQTLSVVRLACKVVPLDVKTHELGLDLFERWQFSIYDAMIVAAALRAGCRTLHSEDMHEGLQIDHLTIRNPFRTLSGPA